MNSVLRKYKAAAHLACLKNPISQPSIEISPIWYPLISKRLTKQYSEPMQIILLSIDGVSDVKNLNTCVLDFTVLSVV